MLTPEPHVRTIAIRGKTDEKAKIARNVGLLGFFCRVLRHGFLNLEQCGFAHGTLVAHRKARPNEI